MASPIVAAEMVLALYHDPSRTAEANAWLVEMQEDPAGWQLAPQLLQADAPEVCFYGANVLYQKCRVDLSQLGPEARKQLLGQMLCALSSVAAGGPVCKRLCLAVAAVVVGEPAGLTSLLSHSGFEGLERGVMLQVLAAVPAELSDSTLSSRQRDDFIVTLRAAVPIVFAFFSQAVESDWGNASFAAAAVAAVREWAACDHSGLTLPVIAASYTSIFRLLFHHFETGGSLALEASEALVSSLENTPAVQLDQGQCFAELTSAVLAACGRYQHGVSTHDEEACSEFVQVATALAGVSVNRLVMMPTQGADSAAAAAALLDVLLAAVQHPIIRVSDLALEFWMKLPEHWGSFGDAISRGEVAHAVVGPLYTQLLKGLVRRAAFPNSFERWDQSTGADDFVEEDEFAAFRTRVKEVIQTCVIVLHEGFWLHLEQLLSSSPTWSLAEAALFACHSGGVVLRRMLASEIVPRETIDPLVNSIFAWVLGPGVATLQAHPVAQQTAIRVVAEYAHWATQRPELVQSILQWLLPQLRGAGPDVATTAAACFGAVACKGQQLLSLNPGSLLELAHATATPDVMVHGPPVRRPIAEGLARVTSLLKGDEQAATVEALVNPLVQRLVQATAGDVAALCQQPAYVEAVAAELVVLAETIRFLEGDARLGERHPARIALSNCWSSIFVLVGGEGGSVEAIADAFSSKLCSAAFSAGKEALLPMLGEILKVLAHCFATSSSAGCLDAVGTAIKVYGHHSDLTSAFVELVAGISTVTFTLVQTDVNARPLLVGGYFGMLLKACIFCPEVVIASPAMGDVLMLSIACLSSRDPVICGQLFACLLKLLQSSVGDARLMATFEPCLGRFVGAVLYAIADTAPAHQLGKLADILQCLLGGPSPRTILAPAVLSQAAHQAVATALGAGDFPTRRESDTAEHRHQFLQLLPVVVHAGRRFRPFVQDFAKICRGEQTIDALVAYQM